MSESKVQRSLLAKVIATFGYIGFLPKVPGTWASLVALPLTWFFWQISLWGAIALLIIGTGVGVWAAHRYDRDSQTKDNSAIVIDEVLGILVATALAPPTLLSYGIAFILFRFFDICKPFPINWCDKHIPGGLGVVLDDIVAGLFVVVYFLFVHPFLFLLTSS